MADEKRDLEHNSSLPASTNFGEKAAKDSNSSNGEGGDASSISSNSLASPDDLGSEPIRTATCNQQQNNIEVGRDNDCIQRQQQQQQLSKVMTGVSIATNATSDPVFEIDFEDGDPDDPKNWPLWYRSLVILFVSYSTMTVVMYSTAYASGIPGMMETFHIKNETLLVLGITTYLLGLATGAVVLAPLSEMYGRRPIYIVALAIYAILVIPGGTAKNLEAVLIPRYFCAFAGSAMIGNSPGSVTDVVPAEYRALALSVWSIGPLNGPVIGPLVGGFVYEYLGWRWTNWIVLISSGVSFVLMASLKETYAPSILRRKAAQRRKETGDSRWWSRYDEKQSFIPLLKVNLSRPFIMAVTEPICIFWNLYVAVVYAILYLCFVAYPIIFTKIRGWTPGFSGLAYVGIGTGSLIAICSEPLIRKIINSHKPDPTTGRPSPEAMVSVICAASIAIPVGEFIFAWTCTPNVHWIAPIIAGVPFGMGTTTVFIYAGNYLVHSFGIYAASALAGNSVLRSVLGGTLPLAGPSMYATLGPHWAGTLLALLATILIPIPFVFYRYGSKIREKSTLIRQMVEDQQKLEKKKQRQQARAVATAATTTSNNENTLIEKEIHVSSSSAPDEYTARVEEEDVEKGMARKDETAI